MASELDAFSSAPIKLAARIVERREQANSSPQPALGQHSQRRPLINLLAVALVALCGTLGEQVAANEILATSFADGAARVARLRHQTHYLNVVPSTHFSYNEGRQSGARSLGGSSPVQSGAAAAAPVQQASAELLSGAESRQSHIYKRSSALLAPVARNRQLVSSWPVSAAHSSLDSAPLSRRSSTATHVHQVDEEAAAAEESQQQQQQHSQQHDQRQATKLDEAELLRQKQHIQYHDQWPAASLFGPAASAQNQVAAAKCHKRTLNFCASVLPFNATTFPNIIGDLNRFEVKRSLPFFGFLAKSSCNKRLDELLCLLLEPPCSATSGVAIPPCKKFCRLALEGCSEYIPATLALSSVFDCRQYPDSSDPSVCVNLAQGATCAQDEFKCPDKTCIPRNWLCDGVRDCMFAADEANCTAPAQASVCSTEEFKCDGKCVPKAWKCDGERDCLDGSDEESCDLKPRCGQDRFKCADGNGCIPKRWVCDGKAECRDGSDELGCEQRDCSETDFKCDNGICIPKLWRCDRQSDCRDGSDERSCVFSAPALNSSAPAAVGVQPPPPPPPPPATTWFRPASDSAPGDDALGPHELGAPAANYYATSGAAYEPQAESAEAEQVAGGRQQLEASLGGDVSRIIQLETSQAAQTQQAEQAAQQRQQQPTTTLASSVTPVATTTVSPITTTTTTAAPSAAAAPQLSPEVAKQMKKFDYELIQSAASNLAQLNELAPSGAARQQVAVGAAPQQVARQQLQQVDVAAAVAQQAQPLSSAAALPAPQRVPIYRSLFKTFKGGHQLPRGVAQLHQNGNPTHRNVVAVARRRRDRQQVVAPEQQQPPSWPRPSGEQHQMLLARQTNQTRQAAGVASYLQLLNGRYNLRLPRT